MKLHFRLGAGLGILIFLALAACSSLSPVSGVREDPMLLGGIAELRPDWRPFAAEESPALAYFAGRTGDPRLEFYALKIDLRVPGLRILIGAGEPGGNGGEAGSNTTGAPIVPSTYVSSFVRNNGLLAGINTTPFDPSSDKEGEDRWVVGIAVSGGRRISPPVSRYAALVFYRQGGAAIVEQAELAEQPGIEHAAGGFHVILRDGELTERALRNRDNPRYPRSVAGLSEDGKTLYLLAIDGKRPGSQGATEAETALILKRLGANDGINLDGGGSSALALRFPDGETRVVNTPVHGIIPGKERAVAICLGIGLD
jgi:hypothetical protein